MFHYNCLNANLKNLNGIFLDEAQEAYVKRYYPRVKQTLTMPLGAAEAVTGGRKKETEEILSWEPMMPRTAFMNGQPLSGAFENVYEGTDRHARGRSGLPMETGFRQLLKAHGEELPDDKFALFMNAMYPVDAFIRDYFRKAAVDELVSAKIPVRLVGEGWEKYESCNEA